MWKYHIRSSSTKVSTVKCTRGIKNKHKGRAASVWYVWVCKLHCLVCGHGPVWTILHTIVLLHFNPIVFLDFEILDAFTFFPPQTIIWIKPHEKCRVEISIISQISETGTAPHWFLKGVKGLNGQEKTGLTANFLHFERLAYF